MVEQDEISAHIFVRKSVINKGRSCSFFAQMTRSAAPVKSVISETNEFSMPIA